MKKQHITTEATVETWFLATQLLNFWERILDTANVKLVILAMPHHQGNQTALDQLKSRNFKGQIAAIAEYPDQLETLKENGVDAAFNIYSEASSGFARHVCGNN